MKRNLTFLFAVVLMSALCVGFVACKDANEPDNLELQGKEVEILVTSSIYLQNGSDLPWDIPEYDKLYIIRSSDEMTEFIVPSIDSIPSIDFSKHSLLLVQGGANRGISLDAKLVQNNDDTFSFNVYLLHGQAYPHIAPKWKLVAITPALSEEVKIELNVQYKQI